MRRILVDSSIWIDYFRDERKYSVLDGLIADNQICVNDVILSELLPFLYHDDQQEVAEALLAIPKVDISMDWRALIHLQTANLLGETAMHLGTKAMSLEFKVAFAHSQPFLEAMGDTIMGWMLLWRAVVASQKLGNGAKKKDTSFYLASPL